MNESPYYASFLRRFVLRKNLLNKAKLRLRWQWRKATKDPLAYLERLFEPSTVTTIFDVGANVGFVSHAFAEQYPTATVHSFEPNPAVFEQLQRYYATHDRIRTHQLGVADRVGTLPFHLNKNTGTSSFLAATEYHLAHQAYGPLGTVDVPVTTLDAFCEQERIEHVNVLKLDVEGYELKALQGAKALLARQACDAIYTEVNVVPTYTGQPLFHELTSYLAGADYHLFNFDDFLRQESEIGQAVIGNAIYISGAFRARIAARLGHERCGW